MEQQHSLCIPKTIERSYTFHANSDWNRVVIQYVSVQNIPWKLRSLYTIIIMEAAAIESWPWRPQEPN